jgi:lipopolysaccharide biosynthesis glycosyltransferase
MTRQDCTIAIASDDKFVIHLCTLIVSILENRRDSSRPFRFVILENNISTTNKKQCRAIIDSYDNTNIDFYSVNEHVAKYDSVCHMHFTPDTFSRLYLSDLLPTTDKIIYLDADTCVLTDISKLFDLDITPFYAGVVYDYIMNAFSNRGVRSPHKFGSMPAKRYIHHYLKLSMTPFRYFQAGVLLLNLKKIKDDGIFENTRHILSKNRYWFVDQDALNITLKDKIIFLDPKWNVVNVEDDIVRHLLEPQKRQLLSSQNDPYIVHYAGENAKPWINPKSKMSEYYFKYRNLIKL